MPGGRPSTYTPELAAQLCKMLASGMSLRTACKEPDMPDMSTVFNWMRLHEGFSLQYMRAKEESADALVEEMLDIADDGTNDWIEARGTNGEVYGWKENSEAIQRSRLRVDTRKWIASKLKPKRYGEKLALTDPDGGAFTVTVVDPTRASNRTPE